MSTAAHGHSTASDQGHGHGQGHGDHHNPYLAHHFDTPQQQFDSGKLGIWLFLIQEILFFSGLFCAYAVYRGNHPEVFVYAHKFLDVKMGAINTCVLLFSSLTAAWAVRCAQLNQKRGLILMLSLTIACAFGFMGIKYVEYKHKWEDGLLWGKNYKPSHHATVEKAAPAPGTDPRVADAHRIDADAAKSADEHHMQIGPEPKNVHIFFGIYFAMTGLHGIHVVAGIILFFWLLLRAVRGEFNSENFAAVDFSALYWHLVDLVWIYLFPLLYLIH